MSKDVLVKEVMKVKPVIIQPFTTVLEAARIMRDKKLNHVLVAEVNHPVGILTESDIIKKVVCEQKHATDVSVEDVMSAPLVVIEPYISLKEALKIMGTYKVRQLPVIEKNELAGLITQQDILRMAPTLTAIAHEWSAVDNKEEEPSSDQLFSGKCEDCSILSTSLKNVDGKLLCEECSEG
jgi:CBS domain-containing protein